MATIKKRIKKDVSTKQATNDNSNTVKTHSFNFKLDTEVQQALKQARLEVNKIKKHIYINKPLSFEEKAFAFLKHS